MKLCISSLKGFHVLQLDNIIYCESEASYTIFHLSNDQKVLASKSILEYEQLLEQNDFVRIHRSYLVNLNHIKEYQRGEGGSVLMSNNKEVEVSRRKKEIFINKMKEKFKF